ncbi:MAG: (Fe-S)-binding protein [Deltaproteobacteria bacterium]|nr:(Fe-S)-binding protein [Deltaproteobacteria bacterium]
MKTLAQLREEINKCVKCGTCRSICPTFRVIGRESASARGKLALIQSYAAGELPMSETYVRHIKECTLCGACMDNCPNGVDTIGIITAARADAVERQGMPYAASFIMKTLLDPGRLMPMALKFASRIQGLLLKDSSVENGLLSRFSLPVIGGGRLLPPLARQFFLDTPEAKALFEDAEKRPGPQGGAKTVRVAFYAGCGVNYLMPEVGAKSLDVLRRAGVELVVPSAQTCCGMPAFSMGDVPTARAMALKNLEAFEAAGFDYITTSCATCGHALKHLFRGLLGDDPELRPRVEAFSAKVRDITELLVNALGFVGKGKETDISGKTVTYHDPCHLNRAQGIRREPRELISNAKGVAFKEMRFPCGCCGLGGGLSTTNYELSMEITRRKAEGVRDAGADVVVTACPGCIVQLRDGLHRYGVDAKVAHVVDLL